MGNLCTQAKHKKPTEYNSIQEEYNASRKPIQYLEMPDYFLEPESERPKWLDHLDTHGVVVVKGVLSEENVKHAIGKYWDWLQLYSDKVKSNYK